jgi:hypothetical protein
MALHAIEDSGTLVGRKAGEEPMPVPTTNIDLTHSDASTWGN